jgi:hypothetical protein
LWPETPKTSFTLVGALVVVLGDGFEAGSPPPQAARDAERTVTRSAVASRVRRTISSISTPGPGL